MTTLVQHRATAATASYTQPSDLAHDAPTTTRLTPQEELTRRFEEALRARKRHPAKAAELFADVAARRARVLGDDHPDTLQSRHYHAHCLGLGGKYLKAARLFADVAADQARVLGPDHPDTLQSRSERARFLSFLSHRLWRR